MLCQWMFSIQRSERLTVYLKLPFAIWLSLTSAMTLTCFNWSETLQVPKHLKGELLITAWYMSLTERDGMTVNQSLLSLRKKEGEGAKLTKSKIMCNSQNTCLSELLQSVLCKLDLSERLLRAHGDIISWAVRVCWDGGWWCHSGCRKESNQTLLRPTGITVSKELNINKNWKPGPDLIFSVKLATVPHIPTHTMTKPRSLLFQSVGVNQGKSTSTCDDDQLTCHPM